MSGSVRTGWRGRAHYRRALIPTDVKLWAVPLSLAALVTAGVYLLARGVT